MKIFNYLFILVFLTISAAQAKSHLATPNSKKWGHFQTFPAIMAEPLVNGRRTLSMSQVSSVAVFDLNKCKADFSQKTCLTDPLVDQWQPRKCLPNNSRYVKALADITDLLNPETQKAFCALAVIYIEQDIESIAYAGMTENRRPIMGIKKEMLESEVPASVVFSWKEQKAFGIQKPLFQVDPLAPALNMTLTGPHVVLRYVITHEMGHVMDFANDADADWSKISWSFDQPKDLNRFPLWNQLCFYNCGHNDHIPLAQMNAFYDQLYNSSFVTTYSAVNSSEDFAESFAFYLLSQDPAFKFYIETPQITYMAHIKWLELDKKRGWLERFFEDNPKYP